MLLFSRTRDEKLLSLLFLLCSGAVAQNIPAKEISVPLLVEDSHHQPVATLHRESLTVRDHKSGITEFTLHSAAELPLKLGIVIDTSKSEHAFDLERLMSQARDLAMKALRSPADRVLFMRFDSDSSATPWLSSGQVAQVPSAVTASGGTALYDAILRVCKDRMSSGDLPDLLGVFC